MVSVDIMLKKPIQFINDEGVIAESDKENDEMSIKYFADVLNMHTKTDWEHVNELSQKNIIEHVGDTVSSEEFNRALVNLC